MKKWLLLLSLTLLIVSCGEDTSSTSAPKKKVEKKPVVKEPVVQKTDTSLTDNGDAVLGEATFKKTCVACHQADGTGMNGMLAANFVKEKARLAQDDKVLLNIIANGKTGKGGKVMPPQKDILTEKEMIDVLTYIRKTFWKKKK